MTPLFKLKVAQGILGLVGLAFVALVIFCLITDTLVTVLGIGFVLLFGILMWAAVTVGEEI